MIGISNVFEVANITPYRKSLDADHTLNLLRLLKQCLLDGDESIEFQHDRGTEEATVQQEKRRIDQALAKAKAAGAKIKQGREDELRKEGYEKRKSEWRCILS